MDLANVSKGQFENDGRPRFVTAAEFIVEPRRCDTGRMSVIFLSGPIGAGKTIAALIQRVWDCVLAERHVPLAPTGTAPAVR